MQRPDEAKRRQIAAVAARLFATRPFHEVKLEDVAAEAQVGKGTLYGYFENKDDLYRSIIRDGFTALVREIQAELEREQGSAWQQLRSVVVQLVRFAFRFPEHFHLMRAGMLPTDPALLEARAELVEVILAVLRRGIERREMADPHPELTAQYVPSFVRAAMMFGPADLHQATLHDHILHLLANGLRVPGARREARGAQPRNAVNRKRRRPR